MEKEVTSSAQVYKKDLDLVKDFMRKHGIENVRDGIRVAIEYANAHGALS